MFDTVFENNDLFQKWWYHYNTNQVSAVVSVQGSLGIVGIFLSLSQYIFVFDYLFFLFTKQRMRVIVHSPGKI